VALSGQIAERAAEAASEPAPIARAFEILRTQGVVVDRDGAPVDVMALPLRDAHVLRALVCRADLVQEAPRTIRCHNCGEPLTFAPSRAFEPGPFVDGELGDPELDAPFAFEQSYAIAPSLGARTVRLAPRTVEEAWLLASSRQRLPMTRAVVIALGIIGLGRERSSAAIARALERAGDRAWTDIGAIWEMAHYAARLRAEIYCACGARNEHPVPADRELDVLAPPEPAPAPSVRGDFPDEERFAAWMRQAADRAFHRHGVRNIDVILETGVPACDGGGEPLLGSYQPPGADGLGPGRPEIRVYYRTFAAEHAAYADFDVRAEIDETIDHEVIHHIHYLRGDDPMDEEERAVIAAERAQVVGRSELLRRSARGALAEVLGFVRVGLPLLILLGVLFVFQLCRGG
jgi:hypothetical protein